MIQILINNKPVSIPTYKELTIKQYSELMPFIAESGAMDVLRYISVTTETDYAKALHFELKKVSQLNTMLGEFKFIAGDVDKAKGLSYIEPTEPFLIFKFGKYTYDLRRVNPVSIGYRMVLEQFMKTKPTYLTMYVFMAAVIINVERDNPELAFDYNTILEVVEELQDYNACKVLTLGAFFFYKWSKKENKESWLSRALKRVVLINMRRRNHKLVLIDSRNMPRSTKS